VYKVNDNNRRIRILSQRHGSADPDPDLHQNVMDQQLHCFKLIKNVRVLVSAKLIHMRLTQSCIKGGGGWALSQPAPYKCSIFGTCSADLT
jgi:hypothetical protein